MTRRMKALLTILVLTLVGSIFSTVYFVQDGAEGRSVIVRVDGAGTWRCSPAALAYYFASQDQLRSKEKRDILPEIRKQQVVLRTKVFLGRDDSLLRRVGEMEWNEFERLATPKLVASKSPDLTKDDYRNALKSALIR
jgi:hypothetical protein